MIKNLLKTVFVFMSSFVIGQTPVYQFNFDNSVANVGNTITLSNLGDPVSYVTDRFGNANAAINFAANNVLWSNSMTNLPAGNATLSVSFWVKYNMVANNDVFGYGTNSSYGAIGFQENVTNSTTTTSGIAIRQPSGTVSLSSNHFTLVNTWYHYVVTTAPGSGGSATKVYRNGNLILNTTAPFRNIQLDTFTIGNYIFSANSNFNGAVDDFRVYNVELNTTQINQIYNASNPNVSAPAISSVTTSNITASTATIGYGINANGANATTVIRYGTSSSNLNLTFNCPSTTSTAVFSEILTGLTPSTTYFYKIESSNTAGTTITPTTYTFTTTAATSTIGNGLVAYYGFENFNSHNGLHNLTPSASTPILDGIGGKVGLGARFESANSQQLVNSSSLNTALDGTEFTICYWVNSQANSSSMTFPTHFEMFGSGFVRQQQNTGYASLTKGYAINATTFNTGNTTVTNINGTWKHIALVHKSGTTNNKQIELYVDGVLQGGFPPISNVPVLYKFNTDFYIGGGGSAVKYFKGYIDEFYIYNRALNGTEINAVKDNTNAALFSEQFSAALKFSMYPNPTNDWVTIETDEDIKQVEVFSLQGQLVFNTTTSSFSLANLNSGIYIVKLEGVNGEIGIQKLIKN
ncbi:LamG-like jellyroll fold domain-containing protein [Flavobacterium difficile]|uniref:T9SS type A sorting domain-containing protein n=1 Tax=Flavobacterium difficile TaxID=2709659 RepID=A0ABX0I0N5_9FLAO|nr:LamG-like jellyroll fold domain-containing protein [Flavobacterium difficile]NHM00757.1 T9SS type A sorting domain-containing protein [Flavobacterium difficile]